MLVVSIVDDNMESLTRQPSQSRSLSREYRELTWPSRQVRELHGLCQAAKSDANVLFIYVHGLFNNHEIADVILAQCGLLAALPTGGVHHEQPASGQGRHRHTHDRSPATTHASAVSQLHFLGSLCLRLVNTTTVSYTHLTLPTKRIV